jgi:AMMECR1 domain-containing protein
VAVEHQWERETFLEHACRKAGLPPDAWRQAGCEIRVFTATLIRDEE